MIPTSTRVFVCTVPQDMRRGFDLLAQVVLKEMGGDPRSGDLFVFTSRGCDRVKLLWWERNGYAVLYKRLHGATTRPPKGPDLSTRAIEIDGKGLAALMRGVDRPPRSARRNRS